MRSLAAAFAAGAATVLAFAPVGFFPAAIAGMAILVYQWLGAQTPRRAFACGYVFGFGFFGAGVSWVYVSINQFGGMSPPLAAIATLLFCAFLALFPATAGWLQAQVPAGRAARAVLVIPATWLLVEWIRSWVLTGFPWLSLGYAVLDTPLAGFAPVLGVFGCSLAVLASAALVSMVAGSRSVIAPVVALAVLFGAGLVLRGVEWSTAAGKLTVALLQGNIEQAMKFEPGRYEQTLEAYAQLAEGTRAKLIVLPETAVPRFADRVDPAYFTRLRSAALRNGGDLLLGIPVRTSADVYLNSVVSLGTSAGQRYDKSHLVPFGEFNPPGLAWVLRGLSIPLSDFTRGTDRPKPMEVAGARVAISVCYEDAFGEEVIRQLPRATVLVNVSNVAWFGDSLAPAQHLQIARLRAVETGRMHLTATNTGITAAIDRDGRVLATLPQFHRGRLEIEAIQYEGATPYVRIGDLGALTLAALMLIAAAALARAGARR
jgi:apolipoprotein N-acyltransferase